LNVKSKTIAGVYIADPVSKGLAGWERGVEGREKKQDEIWKRRKKRGRDKTLLLLTKSGRRPCHPQSY